MNTSRKQRKALQRVEPGSGRQLKPFRRWQPLSRALFHLPLIDHDGQEVVYSVDVPYWQRAMTDDGHGRAHLYLDGRHHARSKMPAVFPVPGGLIEVAGSSFGLKQCRYVTTDGETQQLIPDERSAEGRRANLDHDHPALSRLIGALSLLVLLISVALLVPQILELLTQVPPITERFGSFNSPVNLPIWLNVALGLTTATASVERATRLRYNVLLDGAND